MRSTPPRIVIKRHGPRPLTKPPDVRIDRMLADAELGADLADGQPAEFAEDEHLGFAARDARVV